MFTVPLSHSKNGADEEYFSTKEDLQVILDNTPFLQYLYVVKVEPDGFHIVYDLTTSDAELEKYMETEPSELAIGTVFPFEKGLEYYVPALLAGEKVRVSSDNAITATAPKPAALLFDSLDGHITHQLLFDVMTHIITTMIATSSAIARASALLVITALLTTFSSVFSSV